MAPGAFGIPVSHAVQKRLQSIGMTMYVSNEVVVHEIPLVSMLRRVAMVQCHPMRHLVNWQITLSGFNAVMRLC